MYLGYHRNSFSEMPIASSLRVHAIIPPLPTYIHRGLLAYHAGKRQLPMVRVHSAPAWLYVCRNVGSTSYPNLSTKGLLYGQTQI